MKKKFLGILFGALLLLPIFGVGTASAIDCLGRPGVVFYADTNYRGATLSICVASSGYTNIPSLSVYNWNDRISSYKLVNFGFSTLRLFPNDSYGGYPYYLTTSGGINVPDVGAYWRSHWSDGFNDQASSLKVYPTP